MQHRLIRSLKGRINLAFGSRAFLISLVVALIGVLLANQPALALPPSQGYAAQDQNEVIIYMFWSKTCPHCAEAKPYLVDLAARYPGTELRFYELVDVEENRDLFLRMASAFGFEASAVPTIFIGDQYWIGFSDQIKEELENAVGQCSLEGCKDAGAGVIRFGEGVLTNIDELTEAQPTPAATQEPASPTEGDVIDVPLIGKVDLDQQSLAVSTALIAFVDGFNPCSIWVLTMLLALTLHTGSRRKVILIGVIFLTITALVYALFIAGLFTVFTFISFVGWIQVLVALLALFFGAVNIKDYFWYKEGLSFTIGDEKKPGIARGIRRAMDASKSLWGLVGATIALAGGVSLVEFSCTAGFPVLWTNILAANNVQPGAFVLLLLEYMLIYQADELVIFFIAVFSLKASRLEEKQGRMLKLIGGTLMLTLAGVMLINPALLNQLSSALIVFVIAAAVTGLVLLIHRVILPSMGVWIGSEARPVPKKTGRRHRAARR